MALLKLPPDIEGEYWRPITDAQYTACWSEAQMLMFGGAAGPGKTSFIVADAVREYDNPNLRAIVFRESFPQLEKSVMPKMRDIYTQMGGHFVDGRKRRWTFPSGALVYVGVISKPGDVGNYQGGEYCVAKGTPILMADGRYRPIEDVAVGELVQTMEGPKPVTHTFHGMHKPCVEARVWDASGRYVGSQVHPETHPVCGPSSWDSFASLTGDRSGYEESDGSRPAALRPQESFSPVRLYEPEPLSAPAPPRSSTESDSSCRFLEPSLKTRAGHSREHPDLLPLRGLWQSQRGRNRQRPRGDDGAGVPPDSRTASDSLRYCSGDSGRGHGALAPSRSGSALAFAPSRGDAEALDPHCCTPGASGSTPPRSHLFSERWYSHPYTNERRPASWASSVGALRMRPVGVREVCDLTVADANHYITGCRLINRNSYIGFDESTYHPESHLRDLLPWFRSTDPSLFKRIRLATNPGGEGAAWHMHTFLRNRCPYHKPDECVEPGAIYKGSTWLSDRKKIPYTVSFIPGLHSDHTLHGADYVDSLLTQGGDRALQFLHGCWCSLQGAYFKSLAPDQVMKLYAVPREWWWIHYMGIDYGYGNSAAAAGLYCVSPPSPAFPTGIHFKVAEFVARELLSDKFAAAAAAQFCIPFRGVRPKIVACFIDPANNQHDGTGKSNFELMAEQLIRWEIPAMPASNDPLGGSLNLASMLANGSLILTDGAPETYKALSSRMHDPKRPGCYKKVAGDAFDDIADETRYATNTFTEASRQPRSEQIAQKVKEWQDEGMDERSLMINSWRLTQEGIKQEDDPIYLGGKMTGIRGTPIIRR